MRKAISIKDIAQLLCLNIDSKTLKGIGWKLAACFFFASINGVVKYISSPGHTHLVPSSVITFWQSLFGTMFMVLFVWRTGFSQLKIIHKGLDFIRITTAVLGIILWYAALSRLPIAEASSLNFTGPIFTVIGAKLYLNERFSISKLLGIFIGMLGVFIIMRPDIGLRSDDAVFNWALILPLLSAISIATTKLISRKMGTLGDSPEAMTLSLLVYMTPFALVFAYFEWAWPDLSMYPWLVLLGFLSFGAHYSTTKAYQLAEVGTLTPVGFAKLVFTVMIGFIVFGEIPSSMTVWVGLAVIVISAVLIGYDNKKSSK
ncbi:MAG: DMT family transporter [Alphaproteobacteria bacterium]|nr:DMT family transporter [Alphaproteobacteria bacterium]OJV13922.1 MAG: hypothetical protein BGO27_08515 [Alphaproteobacteria bacterium 33-17]